MAEYNLQLSLPPNIIVPTAGAAANFAGAQLVTALKATGDAVYGGTGTIFGTVRLQATTGNTSARCRIRLHLDRDGYAIREVWTNPNTGSFTFADVSTTALMYLHASDPTGAYRSASAVVTAGAVVNLLLAPVGAPATDTGTLSGTVAVSGVPQANVAVGLLDRVTMQLIERKRTAADGSYQFTGLDRAHLRNYLVLALDPNENAPYYYTVARDHLTAG